MAFNSFSYFLFLPVVYLLFFIIGDRGRWLVLLLASIAFYAALRAPYLLATLGVVTVLTYAVGIRLADCSDPRLKKAILWSGVAGNILILAILKYLPFLAHSINAAYGTVLPIGNTLVSIGVSYFTLQAISYLSDIYLEIEEPERHFG